jgi:OFA family oxalate/formate antiporter-like MFS transporter
VPLAKQFGWSISEITLTFTISIFVLGFAAFFGGLWLNRKGPRIVALTGGALYGLGVFLASFSHSFGWLYLSYGLIGGIGLGLGYIVPVAVLVKWFPDRRGLITGIAVGGFGAGALITAPVATRLIQSVGVLSTFAYLGIAYLMVTIISGAFMQNPLDGWKPEGWSPTALQAFTTRRARLRSERGVEDLAMVRSLAAVVSKYLRRHFNHLAGGAYLSRIDRCQRNRRCRHGRPGQHR